MPYPFKQIFAADPSNPDVVAVEAEVLIFAPGDETRTPLAITDPTGVPLPNPIKTNEKGFASAFIADIPQAAWEGAGLTGFMESFEGMRVEAATAAVEATSARQAAELSAASANVAATEAVAQVGASLADAVAAAQQAAIDAAAAAQLVEAPADNAMRALIESPGTETASALSAAFAGKPDNGARAVGKGELAVNVRDYKGAGDPDDAAAIAAAHAARPVVLYPDGNYSPGATLNLYQNTIVTNALGPRIMGGTPTAPLNDKRPVMWVQKHINSDYAGGFDQGAIYGATIKESGDSFNAAVSGYAVSKSGSGDTIGIHGRARAQGAGGQPQIFGGWFYADLANTTPGRVVGLETDIRNVSVIPTWQASAGAGGITGMVVALSDGTYGAHQGIRFPQRSGADMQRFWTGLQFDTNSIQPTNAEGEGEAIRVRGANYNSGRYGAITVGDSVGSHMLTYGFRALHADITAQRAIWLARNHRILFGPEDGSGSGTWITITNDASRLFDVHNASLAINGTKVVGGRRTGWGAASGTVDRTAWSTYTAPTVSATPTQTEVQALANHVQLLSRHLAALQQDHTTHGLIGV